MISDGSNVTSPVRSNRWRDRREEMILKILAALTGFALIIIGLAAELLEPQHFARMYKDLSGVGGLQAHINVIGLGVLLIGAVLLAFASNSASPDDF